MHDTGGALLARHLTRDIRFEIARALVENPGRTILRLDAVAAAVSNGAGGLALDNIAFVVNTRFVQDLGVAHCVSRRRRGGYSGAGRDQEQEEATEARDQMAHSVQVLRDQ